MFNVNLTKDVEEPLTENYKLLRELNNPNK